MDDWQNMHPDLKAAAAAVLGSLVRYLAMPGLPPRQGLVLTFCGAAIAFAFASFVVESFSTPTGLVPVGFFIGVFGVNVLRRIYAYIDSGQLFEDLRERMRGRNGF